MSPFADGLSMKSLSKRRDGTGPGCTNVCHHSSANAETEGTSMVRRAVL